MLTTFYVRLLNTLKTQKADAERQLLQGNIEDFPTYKYLSGKIKGLEISLEIVKDIFKNGVDENEQ
jgi:hypothetical protein